jgi:hypothetical protein
MFKEKKSSKPVAVDGNLQVMRKAKEAASKFGGGLSKKR